MPYSVKNNASSNLEKIFYSERNHKYSGRRSLLSSGNATSYTDIVLSNYAPVNAKFVSLLITCTNTSANTSTEYTAYLRIKGETDEFIVYQGKVESNYKSIIALDLPLGDESIIEYKCEVSDLSLDVDLIGYKI